MLALLTSLNHCFAQQLLSRQKAVEDIDFYVQTMTESHYDPFMYISRGAYKNHIETIKKSLPDSIAMKELVLLFYKITALLNDAHSTPQLGQPLFQDEFKKEQFFPYKLVAEKNRLFVPIQIAADLGIPAGAQITDINGENISKLSDQVQNGIAGTQPFKEEVAVKLFSYFMFLKNIKPPFILQYKNDKGKLQKAVIKTGVTFKKALSASLPHLIKPYDCQILQHKLGYLDVRSLSGDISSFKIFLDTSFVKFKKAGISNLAVDLRKNSGGNTALGDLLFSYITNSKYSWGNKSWKISQAYKKQLIAGGDTVSAYLKQPDGSIWKNEDGCLPVENRFKNNTLFKGKIFFITGPFTFSSAMAVADVVKNYQIGTIIGEPTGELIKDFGEAFVIDLPNSHLKIQSTTSLSHGVNCNRTKNGPVLPDIRIENTLRDKVLEKDRPLEYLLNSIK